MISASPGKDSGVHRLHGVAVSCGVFLRRVVPRHVGLCLAEVWSLENIIKIMPNAPAITPTRGNHRRSEPPTRTAGTRTDSGEGTDNDGARTSRQGCDDYPSRQHGKGLFQVVICHLTFFSKQPARGKRFPGVPCSGSRALSP